MSNLESFLDKVRIIELSHMEWDELSDDEALYAYKILRNVFDSYGNRMLNRIVLKLGFSVPKDLLEADADELQRILRKCYTWNRKEDCSLDLDEIKAKQGGAE